MRSWLSLVITSNGSMFGSRRGIWSRYTSRPRPALLDVSLVAPVRPAAPRSWMPTTSPARINSRHASISRFSSNGSPTCTLGRLASSSSAVPKPAAGEHRRAADAVATGRAAEQHGEVVDAARRGQHEVVLRQQADAHHVDERVLGVGRVEDELAADGRHADRVAVTRHAGHDAFADPPVARLVERAEAQRVEHRDGPGAHREDVAQDAADTGGRALVRLDGARVVVALDAQRDGDAVAAVDHARVFARSADDPRCFGRQTAEVHLARLVGAVLAPHHRIHGQLEAIRLAPEDLRDRLQLVVGQPQGPV